MVTKTETDQVTGTETTGHEWDGIKELNTPLPRWWLWTFYVSVVWAIGYWILMPSWPLISSHTKGFLGYSNRAAVAERIEEARTAQSGFVARIEAAPLEEMMAVPELRDFAFAGGRSSFAVNCSQCHGLGAAGSLGYPNLNDDDWIWGGQAADILQSIRYGIRTDHDESRVGDMPAFVRDEVLGREEARDVTEYVLSLSGRAEDAAAAERGVAIFEEQCVACHQEGGVGERTLGAPNLADGIWLYGGERDNILQTVSEGRAGVMPAWAGRLSEATIKQLAVYVHSLGGGE